MLKKNKNTKKGFSLVETLVAVAIFSLAAVMFAGSFASFLKTSLAAKQAQRNAESAQYVINLMAKTIRTSAIAKFDSVNSKKIRVLDYSQPTNANNCIEYEYSNSDNKIIVSSAVATDVNDCKNKNNMPTSELTKAGEISGLSFSNVDADPATAPYGKVTIVVDIASNDPSNPSKVQTTTSLRQ
ncbi:MAG: type II secretion system protein [Candidatus Moranbacteria bacterium]|nr:type II secretion system protein [Candidatus Moranbacteria bacterium]